MEKEEAEALRKNLSAQVKNLKEPVKAIIIVMWKDEITYEFMHMGSGETADRLMDVRNEVLKKLGVAHG